ncbi:MAG: ADP-ribosylglycohydrolase family protein [Halioglobus sp.]|nr:ADP-ribosylglycohydrolase family protein [Halioglobus sp.]
MEDQSRFRGCLLAGAVGDALGAPIEFMSLSRICTTFGSGGIRDYVKFAGRKGAISDETQMTLFSAEALIRGSLHKTSEVVSDYSYFAASAYQRWLLTQGESNAHGLSSLDATSGWLYDVKKLHARRAPGRTCRAALRNATEMGEAALNTSKGCGGATRVAPAGLFATTVEESFELGCHLAAQTHGHPTGWLSGGAMAVMITVLKQGAELPDAIDSALKCLADKPDHQEVTAALEMAVKLDRAGVDHDQAIAQLGRGWLAHEALAIATYCALIAPDMLEGIVLAINHDGVSDSTVAMAGSLLGVIMGEESIPAPWLKRLELRKVIGEMADDLYFCRDWDIGAMADSADLDKRIWAKYPSC